MTDKLNSCNPEEISRYLDGETNPADSRRIEEHLQSCSKCRGKLTQLRETGDILRLTVQTAGSGVDFQRLEQQIVTAARQSPPQRDRLLESMFSWKLALPAAAAVVLLMIFIYKPFQPSLTAGPSAIIDSFTGQVKSVMILETPQNRQTVIWYSEENKAENASDPTRI